MKTCPYCAEEIQDSAIKCKHCGEFLDGRESSAASMPRNMYWGYEYRSKTKLFGLPLVHIARGVDAKTGRPLIARGIIAMGNIAIGFFAFGGFALGVFAMGGISLGLLVLGGIAVGGVSFGGVAIALYLAVGGTAFSFTYAIGGIAFAPHAVSSLGADPELLKMLEKWMPGIGDAFQNSR